MSNLPLYLALALLTAWFIASKLGKVSPAKAHELVAAGARLVDVRSPGEFGDAHLPGAVNIPAPDVQKRAGEIGKPDSPVVVYCASGMRSAAAARTLKALGYSQVFDLGSMSRW